MIKFKRLVSACIITALLLVFPINVHSAGAHSGSFGYADWSFNSQTGVLTLSGNGVEVPDGYENEPWSHLKANIKSVTAQNGITALGFGLFMNYPALTSFNIADSVETIYPDFAKGSAYYNNTANWDIKQNPADKTQKNEVLYIGAHLVEARSLYGNYTVKAGTKYISPKAFANATLYNVTLNAAGVKRVGHYAFCDLHNLKSITFNDSLEYIGNSAFYDCIELASITLPSNKGITIGKYAFFGTSYYKNSANKTKDGCLYVGNHLIDVPYDYAGDTLTVREGTKSIADETFLYSELKVVLPEGIEVLAGLSQVETNIPSTVKRIEDNAFKNTKMTSFVLPATLEYVGKNAFASETVANSKMYVPASVTCLTRAAFPNGMPTIIAGTKNSAAQNLAKTSERVTFKECASVAEFNNIPLPKSNESAQSTLKGASIKYETENNEWYPAINVNTIDWDYNEGTKTLTISGNGIVVANYFKEQDFPWAHLKNEVETVIVKEGITEIAGSAFSGFKKLENITLPDSIEMLEYALLHDTAFYNNPDNWETVYPGTYWGDWTGSVLYVGKHLIETKDLWRPYFVKEGTKTIAAYAFYNSSVPEVYFPSSLKSIGRSAFHGSSVERVTLPEGFERTDTYAFNYCGALTEINLPSHGILLGEVTFSNTGYSNNPDNWENGGTELYLGNCFLKLDFYYNPKTYTVRAGTKSLDGSCLAYKSIDSVTLPYGLECIGDGAFFDCTLPSLSIPASVRKIGNGFVRWTYNLENIRLPYGITHIYSHSFETSIYQMFIPSTVKVVHPFSFYGNQGWGGKPYIIYGLKGSVAEKIANQLKTNFIEIQNDLGFLDVNNKAWYYPSLERMYLAGTMSGTGTFTFEPNTVMTRSMLVSMLYRLEGSPAVNTKNTFTDVKEGAWYTEAVKWAAKEGIVSGTSKTTFEPNTAVSREQMSAILYRYAQYLGKSTSKRTSLASFPDGSATSGWAKDSVSWAVANGLIAGTNKGGAVYLEPKASASRAQIAAVLCRFQDNI